MMPEKNFIKDNLGHIITIGTVVASVAFAYGVLKTRVDNLAESIKHLVTTTENLTDCIDARVDKAIARHKEVEDVKFQAITDSLQNINSRLDYRVRLNTSSIKTLSVPIVSDIKYNKIPDMESKK